MNSYPQHVAPSDAEYCTAPGCRINPTSETALAAHVLGMETPARLAVSGSDLCHRHQTKLVELLNSLVMIWERLEDGLYRKVAGEASERVQTSGIVDISSSWNPDVSEVMADIREWTAQLVQTVVTDFTLPTDTVDRLLRNAIVTDEDGKSSVVQWSETVTTTHAHALTGITGTRLRLGILARHYGRWLASYPGVGPDVLASAHEHLYAANKATGSASVRRVNFRGAVCGEVVEDEALGPISCAAPMVAVFPESDDVRPSVLMCTVHPKTHAQITSDQFMAWALDG